MSFINSVFFAQRKCHLVGGDPNDHICLYPMDIVFALVILLLLIPQVFVVSCNYHCVYVLTYCYRSCGIEEVN